MGIIKASFPRHRKRQRNPARYSIQNKARQILQFKTQKEAAKALGVSDRTIRRWLSGETKQPKGPNFKQLTRQSQNARQKAYRKGSPRRISVPPPIERVKGQDVANARKLTRDDQTEYIQAQARAGKNMRFLLRVPKQPGYERGILSTTWQGTAGMESRGVAGAVRRARQTGEIIEIISD